MKRVLPWLFHWPCRADTRDLCSALAALGHHTLFQLICPYRQQAGQAVVPGRLSLNMHLCRLRLREIDFNAHLVNAERIWTSTELMRCETN
jgi:hypothetical protein